ncbi:uncharacterized protein LOC115980669 [Quercus lobata]|uniref:uncharacterized protein LOC115980669 n=1 Tax=Quercus lobata TaxID=97700 RepID=UPI001249073D|nr:uncharacterized protein LOC115980669 [Quercus lobata]
MESLVGSDDDQPAPAAKEPGFNVQTDMRKPELRKGMKFPNPKVFREALREYAIKKPVDIKFKLNEKKKISVYCINECGWRCYASQLPGELTFQIKTFNPECTCLRSFKHSQVTSSYVAKKFMQEFDKNLNWKVAGVQHHVKQALEINISYNQVYRTKRKATDLITRDEQLQYGKLRDYAEMITLNDKGSRVILQTEMEDENAQPKFKIMYIRYNAQKLGFLGGCRPIIDLDGCHLKGRFGGQILSAIARDANDNIFSVAFAVVEQKNKDLWGLIPAIEMLFPTCEHRYCVKHIYDNFKVDHKGLELKDALWRCAGATTIREFERRMQEMKDLDVKAWEYLADINPAQWSKSHFSSRALCDCLANNLSESFNAMILEARDKPILAMLEWIRVRLMTKQYKKMRGIAKYIRKVCPNIQDKLEKLKYESIPFNATPAGSFMYEVDNGRERHVVDLAKKASSCRI